MSPALKILSALALCLWPVAARAGDVTLAWNASASPDVDHYTLTYGEYGQPATQTQSATTTQTTLSLPDGKYYQAYVTATNTSGVSSGPSNVLVFQSAGTGGAVAPQPPSNLRRGDITVTLQMSPDLRAWTDVGYAVVAAGTARGFLRLEVPAAWVNRFRVNLACAP